MEEKFIVKLVKAAGRNMWITALALVGTAALTVLGSQSAYYNYFKGPFEADLGQVEQQFNANHLQQEYVKVNLDKLYETGVEEITTTTHYGIETGKEKTAEYFLAPVNHKALIVSLEAKNAQRSGEFKLGVTGIPDDVRDEIFKDKELAKLDYFPFMLSQSKAGDLLVEIVMVTLFLAALAGFSFHYLIKGRQYLLDPLNSDVFTSKSRLGPAEALASDLEEHIHSSSPKKTGQLYLSTRWIIWKKTRGVQFNLSKDVIWAYIKAERYSKSLNVYFREGKPWEGVKGKVEDMMQELAQVAPQAVYGYSAQLKEMWHQDRAGLVAAVDAKNRQP